MAELPPTNTVTPRSHPRFVMLGLIALFVGPILIAWAYSAGYLELGSWGRTNRGSLITPPIDLRNVADTDPLFDRANMAPGEWLLLLIPPAECGDVCAQTLERLSTIRSLLGYSGQRIHILFLSGAAHTNAELIPQSKTLLNIEAYTKLRELLTKAVPDVVLPQILFVDWRKQVVLRFDADAPPINVKKDIKRLLRASKIR